MTKKVFIPVLFLFIIVYVQAAENPKAVSPGHELRTSIIDEVCPTFSWTQTPDATAYQIAVFKMGAPYEGLSYYENQAALSHPVLMKNISGSATSWTPSIEESLQNGGRYVWFVQAQDSYGIGTWSMGKKFAVRAPKGLNEIKEKVKKELEARGVQADLVDKAFQEIQSQASESKSKGELESKYQEESAEEDQAKVKKESGEEIRNKEKQTNEETTDYTANTLGSEGDSHYNVYYGTGTNNSLPGTAYENSFFGYGAGYNNNEGDWNTFMGFLSGYFNLGGIRNTFIGAEAGYNNEYGDNDIFLGYYAGYNNTIGDDNTILGAYAGYSNTSGNKNTFVGRSSGYDNSYGNNNTFVGYKAGESNVDGEYNVFMGSYSGDANTSADDNTFIGYASGSSNTTGQRNTFIGNSSGYANTEGRRNIFIGYYSGNSNIGGDYNTFVGNNAGSSNSSGSLNSFMGFRAGYSTTTGDYNSLFGSYAGYSITEGDFNTILGYQAGYNAAGTDNVFLGHGAGYDETGSNKLYIENSTTSLPLIYGEFDNDLVKINGDLRVRENFSLDNGTTNVNDIVTGSTNNDKLVTQGYVDDNAMGFALTDGYIPVWDESDNRLEDSIISQGGTSAIHISGSLDLANWDLSLDNGTTWINATEINLLDGKTSVAAGASDNDKLVTKGYVDTYDDVGGGSGNEGDAYYNVYFGSGAGNSLTSSANSNCFFGYQTGYNTTSGDENTFIGDFSGYNNSTGSFNTFVGRSAGEYNSEGGQNTFVGENSGYHNTTGDINTCIGEGAGFSNETGEGNVFLGSEAGYYETGSNKLYIENSDSSSPLIYGEFDNDLVTVNGHLSVHEGSYLGLTGNTNQLTVDTTSTRARFKLQADGGGTNTDDFFNFTMRNDYGDVTLSVRDSSAAVWLPMLSYEYLNSKVDFKDNDIVTTGTISSGGGAYTSGGAWIEASSRDYKENIIELGQSESIQALETLNPVRYNYKNKKDEEFLGFIAEDVPDLVAMNGRRGMRAMDIVAVLTKVVQDQQKKIREQEKLINKHNETNENQNELINSLLKRINKLEQESHRKQ